jgi:hypothetical protein
MQSFSSISSQLPLFAHGIELNVFFVIFLLLFPISCVLLGIGVYLCQTTSIYSYKESHQRIAGACMLSIGLLALGALLFYSGLITLLLFYLNAVLFGFGVYFCSTRDRFTSFFFPSDIQRKVSGAVFLMISSSLFVALLFVLIQI